MTVGTLNEVIGNVIGNEESENENGISEKWNGNVIFDGNETLNVCLAKGNGTFFAAFALVIEPHHFFSFLYLFLVKEETLPFSLFSRRQIECLH